MEQRAMLARDTSQFGNRLDGANLVVGVHDRDERRVAPDRRAQIVRVDDARFIDR
jgi:hypothetical protein